ALASGRERGAVRLVAVSKTQPLSKVGAVLATGHRLFGENRVQEAEAKWPILRQNFPGIELHLIGPLQTNKVRQAVALFDAIGTTDRPGLAHAGADERGRPGRRPRCFTQVNPGEDPKKAAIFPAEADSFIDHCRSTLGLPIEGLMCIPPVDEPPAPHFALLAEMARRHGLPCLSMGMSADFELAVRMGATHVRIGTAIFG